jgi:hypothetical protein
VVPGTGASGGGPSGTGGSGGGYGSGAGGGGGDQYSNPNGAGGAGYQGVIVISYTPAPAGGFNIAMLGM